MNNPESAPPQNGPNKYGRKYFILVLWDPITDWKVTEQAQVKGLRHPPEYGAPKTAVTNITRPMKNPIIKPSLDVNNSGVLTYITNDIIMNVINIST